LFCLGISTNGLLC